MCEFLYDHPKWFATIQALVDIIGEAVPIMVVFTMQMLKVCGTKKRKSKKYLDPNDTMNSHADMYESRDMGPGLQQASEEAPTEKVGSDDPTAHSVLKEQRSSEKVAELIKATSKKGHKRKVSANTAALEK